MSEVKIFTIVWGLFMSLYFWFGTSEPIWVTAFYSVTILMGINNASETPDKKWKSVNTWILKILLAFFVACYLLPQLDTVISNRIIGTSIALLLTINIIKDYVKRNKQ